MRDTKLEQMVGEMIAQQMPDRSIGPVYVHPGEDCDGDAVLRIAIGLDGRPKQWNIDVVLGFTGLLRDRLLEDGIDAFPIISYVAKNEIGRLKLDSV